MELEYKEVLQEDPEHAPSLHDPFMEEVGEIKLEIHRVRNRCGVVKAFFNHIRNSSNPIVRKEIGEKVVTEADIISASLTKIYDVINRWKRHAIGVQKADVVANITTYLKEVITEYQEVLQEHRELSLKQLQSMLRGMAVPKDDYSSLEEGGNAFVVDKAYLQELNEQTHVEIEDRYCELYRTDRTMKSLNQKFSELLSSTDYVDLAVLQLDKLRTQTQNPNLNYTQSRRSKALILAAFFTILTLSTTLLILAL